ncbi:MAG: class I SAM-dependent methyltransferase [Acidimicrobiales bacterium]|nr:class I SAM-dependent methyltransferase [Acidimicrobiales bacterium]
MDPRPAGLRFNTASRAHLRSARPWHPLAHITRELPRAIEGGVAELHLPACPRVLDLGCAELPYRSLFPADTDYVGADLPGNPHATVEIAPDGTVAVESASFDAVLSTQVLEHVAEPSTYLAECARALRPGGRLLLSTHGIMLWHPDPVDYWRWTLSGLERPIGEAGLEVTSRRGVMGLTATGLQLVQDGVLGHLPRVLRPVVALVMQTAARVVDHLETPTSKTYNALVYLVVAEKPAQGGQAAPSTSKQAWTSASPSEPGRGDT